ncbi:MAG: HEPN domain-containing protein [Pseudomonadota bacterium]
MAQRIKISQGYRSRAKEELEASRAMLEGRFYAASISRAYYAVYYAMTSLLIEMDIMTKTHKQTAIEFRKHFIRTKKLDVKYSNILDELFNVRMLSDYDAIPEIDETRAGHLLNSARDFVNAVLE